MADVLMLQEQIDSWRREIRSDTYPMSIGELMNLYENSELDLHPEFQRFFRWTESQRTRLIESILLGIPLPAVFLVQRDDGVLDVVDGLQRLSTIFQFAGMLKSESGDLAEPLVLSPTKYLPALGGVRWEPAHESDTSPTLSGSQRLLFKRAKINLIILERLSDPDAKYELFQRLNTGGSELSDQEVRNCILLMVNRPFFLWLEGLSRLAEFQDTLTLSDRKSQERYDLELVVRFLVMDKLATTDAAVGRMVDLGDFLTDQIVELASDERFDRKVVGERFRRTLALIQKAVDADAFLPYKSDKDTFGGAFSVAAFEALTFGVSQNLAEWEALSLTDRSERLRCRIVEMWEDADEWRKETGTGVKAENRLPFVMRYAPGRFSTA